MVRVFLTWGGGGGFKRPEREVDLHSPSCAKVTNEGSYRPTSSHRESLQGLDRASFTFNFLSRK